MFADLVEEIMEIFINDFLVFGLSVEGCLKNLFLKKCAEMNVALNRENAT